MAIKESWTWNHGESNPRPQDWDPSTVLISYMDLVNIMASSYHYIVNTDDRREDDPNILVPVSNSSGIG